MKNAVPSAETASERGASSLGFCCHRPEHGRTAVPLLPLSSCAAVVWKRPEPDAVSNRSIEEGERVNRSAAEGKGSPGCRPGSGAHLLISVRGSGIPPRVGKPGEAHPAPHGVGVTGWCEAGKPADATAMSPGDAIGRAGLNPSGRSNAGGCSESSARSYAAGPRSGDGTLQVSRAGNAGKSLTTQISIRPRPGRWQYPQNPGAQSVHKNLSAGTRLQPLEHGPVLE